MVWIVTLALVLAGCGRLGFSDRAGDAGTTDARDLDAGGDALGDAMVDATVAPQPFAHWKLDDGAGTVAADSSGHGHTMNLVNGPAWTAGTFGGGVSTDGVNDYLTAPMLDLSATAAITVSLWVNRTYTAGPAHTLVELSTNFNGSATGFGLFPDDFTTCTGGQIMLGTHGNTGFSLTCYAQPSSGVWHHLVAVYDKSRPGNQETALYIDGVAAPVLANPITNDNTNMFGLEPFFVASRGGSQEFNTATFDELAIYDRALTPAEIAQL